MKCVLITRESQFQRAVYNSCYDPDTVLKLMGSRVGEKMYHPFDNDDFYLAQWCKTGKLSKYQFSSKLITIYIIKYFLAHRCLSGAQSNFGH